MPEERAEYKTSNHGPMKQETPVYLPTPDLEKRFTYHKPQPGQPERYEALRQKGLELGQLIDAMVPVGREKARALSALEDVCFNANAGIARNE